MADKQVRRVYKWEDEWLHMRFASGHHRSLKRLATDAAKMYRVKPVKMVFARNQKNKKGERLPSGLRYLTESGKLIDIVIRPEHANPAIVLHEVAHSIVHQVFGYPNEAIEHHGPEWLGVYMYLLASVEFAPYKALEVTAKEHGLKWAPLEKVRPHKIRKAFKNVIAKASRR